MLALTNVRLIDGTRGDPTENISIIIDGNRIKSVEPVSYPDKTAMEAIDYGKLTNLELLIIIAEAINRVKETLNQWIKESRTHRIDAGGYIYKMSKTPQ